MFYHTLCSGQDIDCIYLFYCIQRQISYFCYLSHYGINKDDLPLFYLTSDFSAVTVFNFRIQ